METRRCSSDTLPSVENPTIIFDDYDSISRPGSVPIVMGISDENSDHAFQFLIAELSKTTALTQDQEQQTDPEFTMEEFHVSIDESKELFGFLIGFFLILFCLLFYNLVYYPIFATTFVAIMFGIGIVVFICKWDFSNKSKKKKQMSRRSNTSITLL